jgi:hypothetical protein
MRLSPLMLKSVFRVGTCTVADDIVSPGRGR